MFGVIELEFPAIYWKQTWRRTFSVLNTNKFNYFDATPSLPVYKYNAAICRVLWINAGPGLSVTQVINWTKLMMFMYTCQSKESIDIKKKIL